MFVVYTWLTFSLFYPAVANFSAQFVGASSESARPNLWQIPPRHSPQLPDSRVQVKERRLQLEEMNKPGREAFFCWALRTLPAIQLGSNLQSWRFPLTFLQHSNYRNGSLGGRGVFIKMKWIFCKAVKKKKRRKITYIKADAARRRLPSPDSTQRSIFSS